MLNAKNRDDGKYDNRVGDCVLKWVLFGHFLGIKMVGHMPGHASGWISFFVIAESSELILCSMLEAETTEI